MAVVIRLARHGGKSKPVYRVVAADKDYFRDGRYLEILGNYNPKEKNNKGDLNADRIKYWLSQGAKPSDTVSQLIKRVGI